MSEGIKYVGNKAFEDTKYYNEQLLSKNEYIYIGKVLIKHKNIKTRVKLEDGVRVISDEAFIDNNILLSIDLPKSLICVGRRAFKNCINLKEVNLPENLENIESEAFSECNIERIEIPKSVRNIGYAAFKDCKELKEVKMHGTPDTIGGSAFNNTSWIMNIKPDEYKCRYFQNILLEYFGREKFIKVKEGTRVIAGEVFRSSEELEKVEFPKSLEYIGYSSFSNCENLKQIIFKEDCNLTVIDTEAFEDCVSLESPVLPEKLKKVNHMAFCRCKKIEEMKFPESVEYISNYALSGCVELKTIKVPKKMEGKYEFKTTVSIHEINPKIIFY
jgi:surface antigen bspA-like